MLENGQPYAPGACTELGCSGAPGTFGSAPIDGHLRIVWHYSAADERRTFTVRYRLRGVSVAYDDVVDVNLKVWGDEWDVRLGQLTATLDAPADIERAWGHPVWVRGDVELAGRRAVLRALDVPAGQFVELRALVPRSALTSTAGAQVREGPGLAQIVAEEADDAQDYDRDRERIDDAVANPGRTLGLLALLAFAPGLGLVGGVWWLFGRDRKTAYDREYEQEPPDETEPALVPRLLAEGGSAGSFEFTATVFDLVRRGRFRAEQVTTERSTWGGLRTEDVADLKLAEGDTSVPLTPFEDAVADVVSSVITAGEDRLSRFRDEIEEHRTENAERFTRFKEAVDTALDEHRWLVSPGLVPLLAALVLFAGAGVLLLWLAVDGWRPVWPRWSDVVLAALGVCSIANAAVVLAALFSRRLWRRRAPAAEVPARRWEAFRRYLTDFPRLHEAPPASLELWERYLVYGIAFGIAERVLQGAHLHMPEALHQASTIYWISPGIDLGAGPSALSIGDLSAGFGSALAPPSSGSGGLGGGFSGGGGGGGGGGGRRRLVTRPTERLVQSLGDRPLLRDRRRVRRHDPRASGTLRHQEGRPSDRERRRRGR